MKILLMLLLLLIPVISISGCTTQVQKDITEETTETTALEKKVMEETTLTIQPKPEETREPKTYQINVVQGIGVEEGT